MELPFFSLTDESLPLSRGEHYFFGTMVMFMMHIVRVTVRMVPDLMNVSPFVPSRNAKKRNP